MLPSSRTSRAEVDSFSRQHELAASRKMKKFYKSHHTGENAKIDQRKHHHHHHNYNTVDNDAGIDPGNVINGQGYVITDRNELLKKLSGKA